MTLELDGLISATILPMTPGGEIDEPGLRRFVRWVSEQGPVALAVNADSGEGPHLTQREKLRVLEITREETDVPLIAGLAGGSTAQAVQQAREYRSAGASGLLVFPLSAYLSAPLDPAIPLDYHRSVAEAGLPLILFQLQPALGGVTYEERLLRELIAIDGVVALKEASFDARLFADALRIVRDTDKYRRGDFTYLTGNDNFIPESFVLGCTGALIGFGSIMVAEQAAMIDAFSAGRLDDARQLGARVQRLADVVFRPPVSAYRARIKELLTMLGVLDCAAMRAPLRAVDETEREILRTALAASGLLGEVAA
jgi:4-hydroxy-tetrahydrodipicolinate synthase